VEITDELVELTTKVRRMQGLIPLHGILRIKNIPENAGKYDNCTVFRSKDLPLVVAMYAAGSTLHVWCNVYIGQEGDNYTLWYKRSDIYGHKGSELISNFIDDFMTGYKVAKLLGG
jgi:hypothetical protein